MFKKKIFIFTGLLIFLFSVNLEAAQDTITISKVTSHPKKQYERLKPFIDYVAKQLKTLGIKRGKVLLARNNRELIKFVKQGKVDIVTETLFSSTFFIDNAGMKILLRGWKKGVPNYHAVIFVRKDSGIDSLEGLKGKTIAFEDPGSTSGYFLPKAEIIKARFQMVELDNYREKPSPGKIGYCFAKSETNIAHWVHKGWANAGALSSIEYQSGEKFPAEFIQDFKIIYETEEVPRSLILVRGDIDPKLVAEIKKVLVNMKLSEEGKKVMWGMAKTTDYDKLTGGPEEAMRRFREKYGLIKEEIEKLP